MGDARQPGMNMRSWGHGRTKTAKVMCNESDTVMVHAVRRDIGTHDASDTFRFGVFVLDHLRHADRGLLERLLSQMRRAT